MTVENLIELLSKVPSNKDVFMSKDPEGNHFWKLGDISNDLDSEVGTNSIILWPTD